MTFNVETDPQNERIVVDNGNRYMRHEVVVSPLHLVPYTVHCDALPALITIPSPLYQGV